MYFNCLSFNGKKKKDCSYSICYTYELSIRLFMIVVRSIPINANNIQFCGQCQRPVATRRVSHQTQRPAGQSIIQAITHPLIFAHRERVQYVTVAFLFKGVDIFKFTTLHTSK